MPYPNEHAARVMNPDLFEPNSFRSKDLKDGVRIILGKLKGGSSSMITQTYRFSVDKFTVEQAKQWLKDHKVKFIKFEPAQNESEKELQHVGVLGMKWGHRKAEGYSDASASIKVRNVSSQKVSNFKRNLKIAALVGGVVGGTVGTIAVARLMDKRTKEKAINDAIALTKKWETQRTAKNVIYLPAHMSSQKKTIPFRKSEWYKNYKNDWKKMDAIADQLRRDWGESRPKDLPLRSWAEMDRVADILRNGGVV